MGQGCLALFLFHSAPSPGTLMKNPYTPHYEMSSSQTAQEAEESGSIWHPNYNFHETPFLDQNIFQRKYFRGCYFAEKSTSIFWPAWTIREKTCFTDGPVSRPLSECPQCLCKVKLIQIWTSWLFLEKDNPSIKCNFKFQKLTIKGTCAFWWPPKIYLIFGQCKTDALNY